MTTPTTWNLVYASALSGSASNVVENINSQDTDESIKKKVSLYCKVAGMIADSACLKDDPIVEEEVSV